jgi:hypothetical protein
VAVLARRAFPKKTAERCGHFFRHSCLSFSIMTTAAPAPPSAARPAAEEEMLLVAGATPEAALLTLQVREKRQGESVTIGPSSSPRFASARHH